MTKKIIKKSCYIESYISPSLQLRELNIIQTVHHYILVSSSLSSLFTYLTTHKTGTTSDMLAEGSSNNSDQINTFCLEFLFVRFNSEFWLVSLANGDNC